MKIEIELDDEVVKRILYRIEVVSERAPWPERYVEGFIAQDIQILYESRYGEHIDSAIMEDDAVYRRVNGIHQ